MRKDYAPQFDAKPEPKKHWLEKAADNVLGCFAIMFAGCFMGMVVLAWLGLL